MQLDWGPSIFDPVLQDVYWRVVGYPEWHSSVNVRKLLGGIILLQPSPWGGRSGLSLCSQKGGFQAIIVISKTRMHIPVGCVPTAAVAISSGGGGGGLPTCDGRGVSAYLGVFAYLWCGGGAGADPGGPREPGSLTPGFEVPKMRVLVPSLIFLDFFSLASLGIKFLSYFTFFHNLNSKIFQPCFTRHFISQLMQIKSRCLSS